MNLSPLILCTLIFFATVTAAYGTAQRADILIYKGEKRDLFSNPLEAYYAKDKTKRPKFMSRPNGWSSGNERGYIATWEIIDGSLYLTGIDSWLCGVSTPENDGCRRATLDQLFGKRVTNGRVFADWYTGPLRVPDGKLLRYVHSGYASLYERDIIFDVNRGRLSEPTVIDNTKSPIPSEEELYKREYERIKEAEARLVSAQRPDPLRSDEPIVAGRGWSQVVIGAPQRIVESVLGEGTRRYFDNEVYFLDYPTKGIQISFNDKTKTVHAIFFYNGQTRYDDFLTPELKTDKGIDWASTPEGVIKTYGKPKNDFKGDGWQRIVYEGIDFRFENGKLVRIGIPGN